MREKAWKYNVDYLKPLDGIRAIAILIVAWYHIWQLSWLQPIKETNALAVFNIDSINFDFMVRTGYQMVDVMILLSGFCLFLPHAKSMVLGTKEPDIKSFYKKRVARIAPSYYFCIIFMFILAIVRHNYATNGQMFEDFLSHVFFVHTYTKQGYIGTKLNGVLWTLAVEVQFYLIFPLVAKIFKKKPVLTYFSMVLASWMFDNWVIINNVDPAEYGMWINQLPTFLSVYANGMMAALIVVKFADIFNHYLEQKGEGELEQNKRIIGYFFTGLMILGIYVYYKLSKDLCSSTISNLWQIENRYEFSLLFAMIIIASVFAAPIVQSLLGNKVTKFLSGISFQFYIWHQVIAVKLMNNRIPYWEGEQTPNLTGDRVWMWKYFILCWVLSFFVAIAGTYLIERPCAKFIMQWKKKTQSET